MTASNAFRFTLGLLVGAVFLYLSVRDVTWAELKAEFSGVDGRWLVLALLFYWAELAFCVLRWRVLLSHLEPPIPGYKICMAYISGYAANNVLPAKLGELFRADLLGRLADASRLTALGSIIVERLFDLISVLVMVAWGMLFITSTQLDMASNINRALLGLLVPISALTLGIYVAVRHKNSALVMRVKALSEKLGNLIHGLHALEDTSTYVKLFAYNFLHWGLNCVAIWCIMMALDVHLNPHETILLLGMTGISAAIPAAPAGIGTMQYAFHLTSLLVGFSSSAAIAGSAMIQMVLLGSATLVGAITYSYAVSTQLLASRAIEQ